MAGSFVALAGQLRKEADRRARMGHHAPAHELRSKARDVEVAAATLRASKEVRR